MIADKVGSVSRQLAFARQQARVPAAAPRSEPVEVAYRALWPERLIDLGRRWKGEGKRAERDAILGEIWLLVNSALFRSVRAHRRLDAADTTDIVAEKSMELVFRIEKGTWDPSTSSPAQIQALMAAVARNGVVDHLRSHRWIGIDPETLDGPLARPGPTRAETPDRSFVRLRFVEALTECAGRLARRARMVWFFRVFYDMSSGEIAGHGEIDMSAAAVDMTFSRARARLQQCMRAKGFESQDLPPGTFTALWEAFRCDGGALPDDRRRGERG